MGPGLNPTEEGRGRLGPQGGRPTTLIGRPAHGPHRLSVTHGVSWLVLHFGLASLPGWLPPINTRGGGENYTHNTLTPNTTLLSSLWSLEAFILDALGSLGGVERLGGE